MIQAVKEFGAELKLQTLLDGEQPLNREIQIDRPRSLSGCCVPTFPNVPVAAVLNAAVVNHLLMRCPQRAAGQRRLRDHIGQVVAHVRSANRPLPTSCSAGTRFASSKSRWSAIRPAGRAAQRFPWRWQLPEVVEHEAVRDVEVGHRAVGARIVRIDRVGAARIGEVGNLVDGLAECVIRAHVEARRRSASRATPAASCRSNCRRRHPRRCFGNVWLGRRACVLLPFAPGPNAAGFRSRL